MTNIHRLPVLAFAAALTLGACTTDVSPEPSAPSHVRLVPASDVEWGALNPLRGDASPRAGTLWGDRGGPVPSGFLVRFVDGFSSPPHIHPVTYRGVVLSGLVHNDIPTADETWLPTGSFWTQPAGEVHITAARGSENVAYIEIERGPYLVHPEKDAFDPGEQPVKIAAADMTWTDPGGGPAQADRPAIATLPGNPSGTSIRRSLVRLPAGFEGSLRSDSSTFHAIVIRGQPTHAARDHTVATSLDPGSYFGSEGEVTHELASGGAEECLIYVRSTDPFEIAH